MTSISFIRLVLKEHAVGPVAKDGHKRDRVRDGRANDTASSGCGARVSIPPFKAIGFMASLH